MKDLDEIPALVQSDGTTGILPSCVRRRGFTRISFVVCGPHLRDGLS